MLQIAKISFYKLKGNAVFFSFAAAFGSRKFKMSFLDKKMYAREIFSQLFFFRLNFLFLFSCFSFLFYFLRCATFEGWMKTTVVIYFLQKFIFKLNIKKKKCY